MLWRAQQGNSLVTINAQIWDLSVPHTGTFEKHGRFGWL